MSVTYQSHRRRGRRRRKSRRFIAPSLLLLLLIAVACYFIFLFPKEVPRINYPMTMQAEIRLRAAEFDLDPARVAAVIYSESSFLPDALSPVGARGLMQIMPETAEWLATKFPDVPYTGPDDLYDPELNMRYGCWYLNYLDARFGGDLIKATAAYHTGQGHVDEWLKDEKNSADGVTLDVIPSSATNTYVNRVVAAYEAYKELYHEAG